MTGFYIEGKNGNQSGASLSVRVVTDNECVDMIYYPNYQMKVQE